MKNRIATAVINLISGLLFLIGPYTIFKVCPTEEMVMTCHWSVRAEAGIGILLIISAILYFLSEVKTTRLLLSIQAAGIYIVGILIPSILIGGCKNKDMPCKSLTFPSFYFISVLGLVYLIGNILYLFPKKSV